MALNLQIYVVVLFSFIVLAIGQVSTVTTVSTTTSTTSVSPTPTPSLEQDCASRNSTCETCVENPKCLFCLNPKKCVPYPVGQVIPHSDICSLDQARWGICLINYKALIISMGVIGGAILLAISCCCVYCCCCRGNKRQRNKYMADEAKWETERENRKIRNDERRQERQGKLDDIRRKYGLMKDDTPYQKFEES